MYVVPDPPHKTFYKRQIAPGLYVYLRFKPGTGLKQGWHIRVEDLNAGGKSAWVKITNPGTIAEIEKKYGKPA
jgi:hypothetical protein